MSRSCAASGARATSRRPRRRESARSCGHPVIDRVRVTDPRRPGARRWSRRCSDACACVPPERSTTAPELRRASAARTAARRSSRHVSPPIATTRAGSGRSPDAIEHRADVGVAADIWVPIQLLSPAHGVVRNLSEPSRSPPEIEGDLSEVTCSEGNVVEKIMVEGTPAEPCRFRLQRRSQRSPRSPAR